MRRILRPRLGRGRDPVPRQHRRAPRSCAALTRSLRAAARASRRSSAPTRRAGRSATSPGPARWPPQAEPGPRPRRPRRRPDAAGRRHQRRARARRRRPVGGRTPRSPRAPSRPTRRRRRAAVAAAVQRLAGRAASRRRPSTSPASAARRSTPTTARRRSPAARPTPADLAAVQGGDRRRRPARHELARAAIPRPRPATASPPSRRRSVGGLLRERLGFKGVVMTDSIEAAAVRATGATEQAAVRSVEAGDDIVLTTGQGSWIRVYRALLARRAVLTVVSRPRARVRRARPGAPAHSQLGHPSRAKRRAKARDPGPRAARTLDGGVEGRAAAPATARKRSSHLAGPRVARAGSRGDVVALITSPALFVLLHTTYGWAIPWAHPRRARRRDHLPRRGRRHRPQADPVARALRRRERAEGAGRRLAAPPLVLAPQVPRLVLARPDPALRARRHRLGQQREPRRRLQLDRGQHPGDR